MVKPRLVGIAFGVVLAGAIAGCRENDAVTTTNQALVRLSVDAPSAVKSGTNFGIEVRALNIGVGGVHDGHTTVTLPSPLTVLSVNAPSGSSASFANGAAGGTVDWTMGTLDSNSQAKLEIMAMGLLGPTEATKKVTVVATMTAQGIKAGDAVAQGDVTLTQ
jgi:hypothetical protein